MKKYDWLIVGSGLFGATFAHLAKNSGRRVLVIDKRPTLGGNVYCETQDGIIIHKYGAHIFHTSSKDIWSFVNGLCEFTPYCHQPIANYKGELYNLPFNMNTFYSLWGVNNPTDLERLLNEKTSNIGLVNNLEEQAISIIGTDVYEKLIKGYTEKQWGRDCKELPSFIIKRIPIRMTFDNNYFLDTYQGIPRGGYNVLISALLDGIETMNNVDFKENQSVFNDLSERILYTGMIDEYFDYRLGALQYRSISFEIEKLNVDNFQGCAVMNFTDKDTPYTRIIEHKHFDKYCTTKGLTIISKEYSHEWDSSSEPYYPINDDRNMFIYANYLELSKTQDKVLFGGRLGEYRYYDMDKTIESAMRLFSKCKEKNYNCLL